ncbi:ribonuclease H-like domain-containing protein [Mucor mucedo]|uniref:ribonuclease H-like domain-containing protein n=1 Tax=Mucor mucedo TaxID=29922 RepID=UPI00221FE7D2|nr:ribonuclease H-like domain-containing protein [Mucor mucedo]KAI7889260.1 ribonuclease H-like domain-containing protein [Mucor mucedo]
MRDLKPTTNRTVGAGLPVAPIATPPVARDKPVSTTVIPKKRNMYTSTSSWHSAKDIFRKKGLTGLYSGFSLHLVRDTVGTAVYFGGYETTKYVLSGGDKASKGSPLTQFLAGGICGIMCWLVVFPLDLVKTLIQKEILQPNPTYKNAQACVKDIYTRNGVAGFYRGITVTLIRAFPIHSLNFLVYEQTLISRQQFAQKLSAIEKAIQESDVIAIDTELSGLHRPFTPVRLYSMKDRYVEYKEASERFLIIQFGMCTFKWDQPSGRYIAKPFNFYIFPTSITGQVQTNRVFQTQAQAFDFLVKQSFDFNKWVYQGIPYMTRQEEKVYVAQAQNKLNDVMPDIPIDDKEVDFMKAATTKIEAWLAEKDPQDPEGVNINAKNAYQRRLIYQQVRKYPGLTAVGMPGFIRAQKFTEKQHEERNKEKLEKFEKDLTTAIGFRKVIDMISESGKIVVGHNMLLDVCHMIGQFVEPLPETLEEFKTLSHRIFPNMIDTKNMCSSEPELRSVFGTSTALEQLRFETNKEAYSNPRIDMHPAFPRYLTEMAHEAGYDAFMTGAVFLKLTSYLDKCRNPEKFPEKVEEEEKEEEVKATKVDADGWDITDDEEEEAAESAWNIDEVEEVYNYGTTRVDLVNADGKMDNVLKNINNKAAIVRTAYDYFDFTQPEVITVQSNAVHVAYPRGTSMDKAMAARLFSKYGKHILEPIDDTSCYIIFENLRVPVENIDEIIITPLMKPTE